MNSRLLKAPGRLHRCEKGITGLETAIILIAFVTVAAVLAYSVLSAGVFSAEKGQEAVYRGLKQSEASMEVVSSVYVTTNVSGAVATNISFQISTVLVGESVDLDFCVVNYMDKDTLATDIADGGLYGFTGTLGPNEVADIDIDVSAYNLGPYDSFTIEILPPTGASIKFQKTLPGELTTVLNLN